ncbi:hypothetical protein [Methylogaea oryzae]|uniref:DNA-binding protein n=1 Tax=Methylogaea oryzae TaxID=1295382 RepID=A0A8D5AJU5_9GAMM|nr:hypothetical protein [Methylogaea oryzae]BBL72791.1 hypothetical protein MoryE10_33970 [Methylogaea oryzae]
MDELQQASQSVPPLVPIMSRERFAELTGLSIGVIDGWTERNYLPTVLIGKHRLVNLVLLHKQCLEAETYK